MNTEARPAFYALAPGRWRDYVTLLHPPYTLWHLSYVAIGASLAPAFELRRLLWGLAAFFLAMGVAAHALDELDGRPLGTGISHAALVALAAIGLAGAVAIGVGASLAWGLWLLAFVAFGAFVVPAYNLQLFGGRLHTDLWFALAWGAFPLLTGYFAEAQRLRAEALLAAVFATGLSLAQRRLSTPVRDLRRRTASVTGTIVHHDGTRSSVTEATLLDAPERALRTLSWTIVALAAALLVGRLA